jgi:UDP-glucuronate 4-epimerase
MTVLVTGVAGFVGFHAARRLLDRGETVVGIDDRNAYYDVGLKDARLARLRGAPAFQFHEIGLEDRGALARIFAEARPSWVLHLAAQAGVRYSVTHPHAYVDANLVGFVNVLEGCRETRVGHLVYASSSAVYGDRGVRPFSERDSAAHPVSLYASTKVAGELMAHAYSHTHRVPTTGVRLFTVYGPWGRPDMAYYQFTRDILAGRPIRLFNGGRMERDFTYIDDVVEGLLRIAEHPAAGDPLWRPQAPELGSSSAPWRVLNLGGGRPVSLDRFVAVLEACLDRTAVRIPAPMQSGDVSATWADTDALQRLTGFRPGVSLEEGLAKFVAWYRSYHGDEEGRVPSDDVA